MLAKELDLDSQNLGRKDVIGIETTHGSHPWAGDGRELSTVRAFHAGTGKLSADRH